MPCKPMPGTMQARLAASAKLSLTVASKTVPPPIAALGSKVQRCLGKRGAGFLGFINCRRDFMFGQASSKYIRHIWQVFLGHCWLRPFNVESRHVFSSLSEAYVLDLSSKIILENYCSEAFIICFLQIVFDETWQHWKGKIFQKAFLRHSAPYCCLKGCLANLTTLEGTIIFRKHMFGVWALDHLANGV